MKPCPGRFRADPQRVCHLRRAFVQLEPLTQDSLLLRAQPRYQRPEPQPIHGGGGPVGCRAGCSLTQRMGGVQVARLPPHRVQIEAACHDHEPSPRLRRMAEGGRRLMRADKHVRHHVLCPGRVPGPGEGLPIHGQRMLVVQPFQVRRDPSRRHRSPT